MGRDYQYIHTGYARAVAEAGGIPVYLPAQDEVEPLLDRIDALLLPGGGDFLPEAPYPDDVAFDPVPEDLLRFDRALLTGALERELPFLGVCYGMQLLAVAYGGSLLYDIASDAPKAGAHQLPEKTGRHPISVVPRSRLEALLGEAPGPVNSLHHQAVADPGSGLRPAAVAADGILEAIESQERRFCLGVQWHPELMDSAHRRAVFGAFVGACAGAGRGDAE